MIRSATFSGDGRYRYRLGRQWGLGNRRLPWLMLNPSTADAERDDPTIRRVIAFSRAWGYDACDVVNLCAFRSTNPAGLRHANNPTGPRNAAAIKSVVGDSGASGATEIVVAWGCDGNTLLRSLDRVGHLVRDIAAVANAAWAAAGLAPVQLGQTMAGAPRHPLYVRAATEPQSYSAHGMAVTTRR
jgi:hypothetical protein